MKWTVAKARQGFSELLKEAAREPQIIYNRNQPVAAVVDLDTLEQTRAWRERQGRSLGEAFGELRTICAEERYTLRTGRRRNRPDRLAEVFDELPD